MNLLKHPNFKKIKYSSYVKGRVGWKGLTSAEYEIESDALLVTGTEFKKGLIDWSRCFQVNNYWYENDSFIQLRENDILITKDGTIGKIAIVKNLPKKATLNSGVFVVRPLKNIYEVEFMYWILNSNLFFEFIENIKIGSTINHLYQEAFENFSFPLPETEEQTKIVSFLNKKVSEIDTLISNKEKLIELLKEERTAIINNAVTKGINPKVKLVDSGIEWLGEMPEHWEVKKLKYITQRVETGITPPSLERKYFDEGNIDWFTPGDFNEKLYLNNSKRKVSDMALKEGVAKIFEPYSIFMVGIGATLGKLGIIMNRASANQQINSITFNDNINPLFGLYFMISKSKDIISLSNASTLAILNQSQTKDIYFTIPQRTEQDEIVKYIEIKTNKIDSTISKIEKEIELIQEYRTALISEAVTGKIDLRNEKKPL